LRGREAGAATVIAAQLDLFPTPAPQVRRDYRDVLWELAFSPAVKDELVAVAHARTGEWLGWDAFASVRERHKIGFCMGHVLSCLVREGRLLEKRIYYGKGIGAEHPGSPEYRGFGHEWSLA